jgi:predicted short-subunit dehydrogenase-like oxidoreductase (DUF2520 family)
LIEPRVKIGFIGAGTVGTALALKLSGAGYPVVAASSRSGSAAASLAARITGCTACETNQQVADLAALVFLTTPDDVIVPVVDEVKWHSGQAVVHCSGADSAAILATAESVGAHTGSIHPLQTFANAEQALRNIPGSTFALEAGEPLLNQLKDIVNVLEGHYIEISAEDRVLYHAAAVMASNYTVTLVKLASDLWENFGISQTRAVGALLPLIRGTMHNIETVGLPDCLTGPISRGDVGTVSKHLAALDIAAPGIATTYREIGRQTIPIALAKGKIDQPRAAKLAAALKT